MSHDHAASWNLLCSLGCVRDEFVQEAISCAVRKDDGKAVVNSDRPLKKILPKLLLVAALAALPASAMGNSSLTDDVAAKTEDVGMSKTMVQYVASELGRQHVEPWVVDKMPPLQRNAEGKVYGFNTPMTDLVVTLTDNGKFGYSYRSQLYATGNESDEQVEYMRTHTRKLPVYEKDGETLVGYYTCGWFWEGVN